MRAHELNPMNINIGDSYCEHSLIMAPIVNNLLIGIDLLMKMGPATIDLGKDVSICVKGTLPLRKGNEIKKIVLECF